MQEKSTPRISFLLLVSIVFFVLAMSYSAYLFLSDRIDPVGLSKNNATSIEDELPELPSEVPSFKLPGSDKNADAKESSDTPQNDPELPSLRNSDAYVREQLARLFGGAGYLRWIGMDHLLERITIVADNISKGSIPASIIRPFAPQGKFSAIESEEGRFLMDPNGYHRYNVYADALAKLDLDEVIATYRTLKPLFDSAYAELGYPDGNFEQAVRGAVKHLLDAPTLNGDVELVRPTVMYKYADPELEALSPAQKQMLRMGPRNGRIIQGILRDFLAKLG